jgi:predicted transcriptional regulator of viral defense system
MQKQTLIQQAMALAHDKGVLGTKDIQEAGIPRVVLSRLTQSGQLERIGRGVYRLPNAQNSANEGMAATAIKVPQAVFCLLSALQFHELTTQLPRQQWIAMPRGSHTPKIKYPPITMVQFTGVAYDEGIETHLCDQVPIKVYGVAKTIADCFKHRNRIGIDVALEALKQARQEKKVSSSELWHYAKVCRVTNVMRPYLEATE